MLRSNRSLAALAVAAACMSPIAQQTSPTKTSLPTSSGPTPIRGAHFPALSPDGKQLCFEYLGDLWTVGTTGGVAKRLTLHQAYDGYPHWSPDGQWIAFSSNREGNFDVYLVPARGGEARQMTFHTADDLVQDWSPDGARLLFTSARESRYSDLYTLDIKDSRVRRLTNDKTMSRYGVFSPDGKTIAYARGRQEWWRPKYKGSANTDLYELPLNGSKETRLTNYDGPDVFPLYAASNTSGTGSAASSYVYFVSDRSGAPNLWVLPPARSVSEKLAEPLQVTHHTAKETGGVHFPTISHDGSRIAYECDFQLWTLPANMRPGGASSNPTSIPIYAPSDTLTNLKQRVTLNAGAAGLSLAPDGKTVAFAARGEIWTLPSTGGEATRLTKTGWAEYNPIWSSDGTKLAYTTDRNGNLDVYLIDVKTKKETQVTADTADDTNPQFSGNGGFLSFTRTGGSEPGLYVIPLPKDSDPKPADATRIIAGTGVGSYDWAPDERWLVCSKRDITGTTDLWIVPRVGGTAINVTRYPGSNSNPQWSRDGRQIVFTSTRNSVPGAPQVNIYSLRLIPAPPQEDEVTPGRRGAGASEDQEPGAQGRRRPMPQGGGAPAAPAAGPGGSGLPMIGISQRAAQVAIEFEDIQNRARQVTSTRDPIGSVSLAPDSRTVLFSQTIGGQSDWWVADIVSGQSQRITNGAEVGGSVEFASDATRMFFLSGTGAIRQLSRGVPAPQPVAFTAALDVDRRVEVTEAFNEAWRNLRTQFYDPKFHGVDWVAVRAKYEPLLAETAAKEDFAFLLQSMIGELNASHTGATAPADPNSSATANLGLTFDQDFSGPGLRVKDVLPHGPADQVGRHVEVGEYVIAIDGEDVSLTEPMYRTLLDKTNKTVELLVNNKPTKEGARTVRLRAVTRAAIDDLEYERWVEARRRKVDAMSGGRLAYAHIKAMDQPSLLRFQREIFGDAQSKQGLVLDVRFNGGGRIHDDLLGILTRRAHVYETPRDAERSTQPFQLWDRPTVLLINEYSASDAEIFPNGFRFYGLGKIVGVPTYGGVIGTVDITLVDGTRFRIPRTGWTTVDGRNLENWGVPPDIRVEMAPEDYAQDNDKQLEAAVKAVLDQMSKR